MVFLAQNLTVQLDCLDRTQHHFSEQLYVCVLRCLYGVAMLKWDTGNPTQQHCLIFSLRVSPFITALPFQALFPRLLEDRMLFQ